MGGFGGLSFLHENEFTKGQRGGFGRVVLWKGFFFRVFAIYCTLI